MRAGTELAAAPVSALFASAPGGVTPKQAWNEAIKTASDTFTGRSESIDATMERAGQLYAQNRGIQFGGPNKPTLEDILTLSALGTFNLLGDPAFELGLAAKGLKTLTKTKGLFKASPKTFNLADDVSVLVSPESQKVTVKNFGNITEPLSATNKLSPDASLLIKNLRETAETELKVKVVGNNLEVVPKKAIIQPLAKGEGKSVLHLPEQGVFARVSESQLDILKNEVDVIPFSKGDMPHLTPFTRASKSAREVSLDEIRSLSKNTDQALKNVEDRLDEIGTQLRGIADENQLLAQEARRFDTAEKFKNSLENRVFKNDPELRNDTLVLASRNVDELQPVTKIFDESVVTKTLDDIENGRFVLPVVVDGNRVIDGVHRLEAFNRAGIKRVPVLETTRGTGAGEITNAVEIFSKAKTARPMRPRVVKPVKEAVVETPKIKESKLAKGVEAKAVKKGIADAFEGLPEYAQVNVKQQAKEAKKLLKDDPDRALRIAMGQELPPEGLLPESVFVAVEEQAIKNKNVDVLRDLATQSNLSLEATGMGQRLRMLAERKPNSPIKIIADVQKSREAKLLKKRANRGKTIDGMKKEVAKDIKKEIKVPKREDWGAFIKSIEC